MISKKVNCEVCLEVLHKYKCPTCLMKYCSVACYRIHKGKGPCSPKKVVKAKESSQHNSVKDIPGLFPDASETEDQISLEQLKMLGQSEEIRHLLHNPHLRTLMLDLDRAEDPAGSTEKAMHEPIFLEFVDACLNVVDPVNDSTVGANT